MNKMLNTNKKIRKCKQTGIFQRTLFHTKVQSKSNIQWHFWIFWLIFIAKDEFLQNSCDFWPKMVSKACGPSGANLSTIIGQKFWGVLQRLLRWYFSTVSLSHTASVKRFLEIPQRKFENFPFFDPPKKWC